MDFVKNQLLQIQAQMRDLSLSTKFLIGALLVIMIMAAGILITSVTTPSKVPLRGFTDATPGEVVQTLQASGIQAEVQDGLVVVPQSQQVDALGALAGGQLISSGAFGAFDDMIAQQSPWTNNAQGQQRALHAKMKLLSAVASGINGVRNATVVIDYPQNQGFMATHKDPSASVTVSMQGNTPVGQPLVQAMAGLVAGAVAEMDPQRVSVIDANSGRVHNLGDPADMLPSEAHAAVKKQEEHYRSKISDLLTHIRGVVVAVTVNTDNIRRQQVEKVQYEADQLLATEMSQKVESTDFDNGGEPGARPNTGMTIDAGGAVARQHSETLKETAFGAKPITEKSVETRIGQQVQQVNVAIGLPRRYFVSIYRAKNPDAEEIDDAALQPLVDAEKKKIEDLVNAVVVAERPATIATHMVYDREYLEPVINDGGGMIGQVLESPYVASGGAMALVALLGSLGLMLYMVRRATRPETLPSVEDLVGLPPTLPSDEDLVGEVEESDTGMQGVELDEEEVNARKMAEQIGDMIKNNPEEAGQLFGRWLDVDE